MILKIRSPRSVARREEKRRESTRPEAIPRGREREPKETKKELLVR